MLGRNETVNSQVTLGAAELADANRDGWVDAIDWMLPTPVSFGEIDHGPVKSAAWDLTFGEHAMAGLDAGGASISWSVLTYLNSLTPPHENFPVYHRYTNQRWLDIDGDGYRDAILTTREPEAATISDVDTHFANLYGGDLEEWAVYYGGPGGLVSSSLVDAPLAFPGVDRNPSLSYEWPDDAGSIDLASGLVDVMDIDGDGWQDVVELWDGNLRVHLHTGERGGGWAPWTTWPDAGVTWTAIGPDGTNHHGLTLTRGWVDPQDVPVTPEYSTEVPEISRTDVYQRLIDFNGDGFVDVLHAAEGGPNWQLFLGSQDGFVLAPENIIAPTVIDKDGDEVALDYLSRTYEAKPQISACGAGGLDADSLPYDAYRYEETPDGGRYPGGTVDTAEDSVEDPLAPIEDVTDYHFCGGRGAGIDMRLVMDLVDLDGDGLPDVVDLEHDRCVPASSPHRLHPEERGVNSRCGRASG